MFLLWLAPGEIYLAISANFFEMLRPSLYFLNFDNIIR